MGQYVGGGAAYAANIRPWSRREIRTLNNLKGLKMNKAFKVLWNQVRGTYVVASEAQVTHGKPGKATKTIVAAAVAGLLAAGGSAFAANTITNGSFGPVEDQYNSTKFVSANGEETVIQTNGDARKLISAILSGDFNAIRGALGTDGDKTTLVGFAGGQNTWDEMTSQAVDDFLGYKALGIFPWYGFLPNEIKEPLEKLDAALDHFVTEESGVVPAVLTYDQGTRIVVGGNGSNPLLIGTVGADNLINTSGSLSLVETDGDDPTYEDPIASKSVIRNGDVSLISNSGNFIGLVGGSSAINVSGITVHALVDIGSTLDVYLKLQGQETNVTLNGGVGIELNNATSAVGVFTGGSALALGGKANSFVNGSTNLVINTTTNLKGYEGVSAAISGAGVSIATMGGESSSIVSEDSSIYLKSGTSVGVLGGGMAVGAQLKDLSTIVSEPPEIPPFDGVVEVKVDLSFELADEVLNAGGHATAEAQNVSLLKGSNASSLGIMGGGLAIAYQYEDATKQSYANSQVDTVTIQIGEEVSNEDVFGDVEGKHDNKSKYFGTAMNLVNTALGLVQSGVDDLKDKLQDDAFEKQLQEQLQSIADVKGVTVGSLGGGLALSWSREAAVDAVTAPQAIANVKSVDYIVNSGYNVGLVGGGMAMSSGAEFTNDENETIQTLAQADVGTVTMQFNGGETIGVLGGGVAGFVGSAENNFGVGASAKVENVAWLWTTPIRRLMVNIKPLTMLMHRYKKLTFR